MYIISDYDNDEDYEYLGAYVSGMREGRDGCIGLLAITHKPLGDPLSRGQTSTFVPMSYRNTWNLFRRHEITLVEVWGTCPWRLYPERNFGGRYKSLRSGYSSHVPFLPKSIAQI